MRDASISDAILLSKHEVNDSPRRTLAVAVRNRAGNRIGTGRVNSAGRDSNNNTLKKRVGWGREGVRTNT